MKILDFLFPPRCAACGELIEDIESDSPFCALCHAKWEQAKIRCDGENFGLATIVYNHGYAIMENGGYAAYLIKYLPNMRHSVENRLIYHLKNCATERTAKFVASEFYALLHEEVPMVCRGGKRHSDTIIAWIPRSKKGKLTQGFDHMERCAAALSRKMGVPAKPLIVKCGLAKEQKHLTQEERRENAKDSMKLRTGVSLESKVIVLIDDIITTGASINAAAKLLYDGGAEQIIALTVAATSHDERIIRKSEKNFNLF